MRHVYLFGKLALALAVVVLGSAVAVARDDDEKPNVIYWPTPQKAVEEMLKLAKVTKDDVVYDLGCGDGRIVLTAAREYGCKAKGFDIDPARIKDCEKNLGKEKEETKKLVKFERKNIFGLDLTDASVITLYLLPELNVKLVPQLKKLKKGSRIVSHAFDMRGYKPDKEVSVKCKNDDGEERDVTLYLWTIPLKEDK